MNIRPKSKVIKETLARKGETQSSIRIKTGLSSTTITGVCCGQRANVSAAVAKKLADALEQPVDYLFEFVHDEVPTHGSY